MNGIYNTTMSWLEAEAAPTQAVGLGLVSGVIGALASYYFGYHLSQKKSANLEKRITVLTEQAMALHERIKSVTSDELVRRHVDEWYLQCNNELSVVKKGCPVR